MSFDENRESTPTQTPASWMAPGPPAAPAGTAVPVQPVQPVHPVSKARKRGPLDYVLIGAVALAIGGVAFAAGRTTAPAEANTTGFPAGGVTDPQGLGPTGSFDPGAGGPGQFGGGLFAGGGLTIEGSVESVDGSSLAITTADGQEMTVTLDGDTTYHEATSADARSVAPGDDVIVRVSGAGRFGGGIPGGGQGQAPDTNGSPSFTATDVTVER